jgi:hypothetical protein
VAFVALFSYLVGKTGDIAYLVVLIVLGFGEAWTLIALALDLRSAGYALALFSSPTRHT